MKIAALTGSEKLMLWVALCLALADMVLLGGLGVVARNQSASKDRGFQSRAATCRSYKLLKGPSFRFPEGDVCLSPGITQWYDPSAADETASASSVRQLKEMVCLLLKDGPADSPEISARCSP